MIASARETVVRRIAVILVLTLPSVVHVASTANVAAQTKQSAKKPDKATKPTVDALPRGPTGKLLRRSLQEQHRTLV